MLYRHGTAAARVAEAAHWAALLEGGDDDDNNNTIIIGGSLEVDVVPTTDWEDLRAGMADGFSHASRLRGRRPEFWDSRSVQRIATRDGALDSYRR